MKQVNKSRAQNQQQFLSSIKEAVIEEEAIISPNLSPQASISDTNSKFNVDQTKRTEQALTPIEHLAVV